jgi:YD repeat-containing protein
MTSRAPHAESPGAALSWKVEYDDQGRVAAEINPAGCRTVYEYHETDGVVRSVVTTPPEGSQERWDFDASGRLSRMIDAAGSTSYDYDSKGRLQKVQRTDSPAVSYRYDPFGRRIGLSIGDFYSLDDSYDFLGRLERRTVKVLDPTSGRETELPICFEYRTGDGMILRTLPNGIRTRWTFNPIGELQEIVHIDANDFVLAELTYAHDQKRRITSIKEHSRRGELTERYTYNKVGRLTQAVRSDGRLHRYAYDSVGNRLAATASDRSPQAAEFDWAGRMTALDGQPCRHDAAGNLIALNPRRCRVAVPLSRQRPLGRGPKRELVRAVPLRWRGPPGHAPER